MKTSLKCFVIGSVVVAGSIQFAMAQPSGDSTATQGHEFITTIARYPKDVRAAVLSVSQYPQTLVKLERIQAKSSQSFQDLIAGYSREEQAQFYELSRYPERLNQLVRDGKKSGTDADRYIDDLSQDSQTKIKSVYNAHFNDLVHMNAIYQDSEKSMKEVIQEYPLAVQQDFKKVVSKPDVMYLLTDNVDMTVNLGQDYQSQPDRMDAQLDSINMKLTTQEADMLADYKSKVENDPNLQNEMKQASDNFSSTYTQDGSGQNYSSSQPPVVNYYNYTPYPYWFSYPYWYSTPIWYPAPYYYYTGFYYGPSGRIMVYGLPHWSYTNWFYHYGYRRYPYLYANCYSYYHWNQRPMGYSSNYRGYGLNGRSGRYTNGRYINPSSWHTYRTSRPSNSVNSGRSTYSGMYSSGRSSVSSNRRSYDSRTGSSWHGSRTTGTNGNPGTVHTNRSFSSGTRLGGSGRTFNSGHGSGQVSHGSFGGGHSSFGGHSGGGSRGGGGHGGGRH